MKALTIEELDKLRKGPATRIDLDRALHTIKLMLPVVQEVASSKSPEERHHAIARAREILTQDAQQIAGPVRKNRELLALVKEMRDALHEASGAESYGEVIARADELLKEPR